MSHTHQSNCLWPAGTIGDGNDSSDDKHYDFASAKAVCERLLSHGFVGNGKVFPVRVWVTENGGEKVLWEHSTAEPELFCRVCGGRMQINAEGVSSHTDQDAEREHVAIDDAEVLPTEQARKLIAAAALAEQVCSLDELEAFAHGPPGSSKQAQVARYLRMPIVHLTADGVMAPAEKCSLCYGTGHTTNGLVCPRKDCFVGEMKPGLTDKINEEAAQ